MPTLNIVLLVVMTVLFLLWAFFMFRLLWKLSRRSQQKLDQTGGGYFTWVGHSLGSFREALSEPEFKSDRRRILISVVLLIVVIIAQPILLLR